MDQNKYIKDEYHPFLRAMARLLDYCFFYSLFVLPLFFSSLIPHDLLHIIIMICIPLFWIPFEALFLHTLATTPGKFLLGIQIRDGKGNKLSLKKALKRSCLVWIRGLCLNMVPFNFFALGYHFRQLKKTHSLSWDKDLFSSPYFKKKRKIKIALSGALLFLYSLFFFTEYELREVLVSDQSALAAEGIFKKDKSSETPWFLFKDPNNTFHIEFPSKPETKESLLPTTSGKEALPFSEIKFFQEEVEYNLSYTTLPKSITKWSSSLVLKGSLKLLSKHMAGGAKIQKKMSTTFKKHPSIEFILLKKGGLESYGRLVLIGSRLYKVEVTYPCHKKDMIQEELNLFLNSFQPS